MMLVYILLYLGCVASLACLMLAWQEDRRRSKRKHFLERREEYYRTGR